MTQSGVSQQIKKLERQLETALLIRDGKSFTLTHAGSLLYQQGKEILRSLAELEMSAKQDDKYEDLIKITSPRSLSENSARREGGQI